MSDSGLWGRVTSWLRTTWRSVLDIIGEQDRTEEDSGVRDTAKWNGTTSRRGIAMTEGAPSGTWVVDKITGDPKQIWGTTLHLSGGGRRDNLSATLTGMWLSKFKPAMFLKQKVRLEDSEPPGYVMVYYLDYPILKAEVFTASSASG